MPPAVAAGRRLLSGKRQARATTWPPRTAIPPTPSSSGVIFFGEEDPGRASPVVCQMTGGEPAYRDASLHLRSVFRDSHETVRPADYPLGGLGFGGTILPHGHRANIRGRQPRAGTKSHMAQSIPDRWCHPRIVRREPGEKNQVLAYGVLLARSPRALGCHTPPIARFLAVPPGTKRRNTMEAATSGNHIRNMAFMWLVQPNNYAVTLS